MRVRFIRPAIPIVLLLLMAATAAAADWPTWRRDAARSNASPDALPAQFHLQWVRQLPPPRPAWPASQTKLQYDAVYQPIVAGKLLIVGSTVNDSITAYETATGNEAWRFYTDGPVRFAPAASDGRVYAASDDGYLYCLETGSGKLIWKFNGAPEDRRIIGNERLVSSWPIRGGPAVADGVVYFAASIWPFMGIFVHAVDAETGQRVWTNSDTGSRWIVHPHGAPSFGSIVPQGYLAVAGDNLIVPGGRSLPAVFDRATGELRHFQFGGKGEGGWDVVAHEKFYVVGGVAFAMSDGASIGSVVSNVLTGELMIGPSMASSLDGAIREVEARDRKGQIEKRVQVAAKESWPVTTDGLQVFAMCGRRVYAGGKGNVASYDVDAARAAGKAQLPEWTAEIDGNVAAVLGGDDRLFVVTDEAAIYCFGEEATEATRHEMLTIEAKPDVKWTRLAQRLIYTAGTTEGYALALGIQSGGLISEIVAQSNLHVIVLDSDAAAINAFRRRMDNQGLYGVRVVAHDGTLQSFGLPPYLFNLVFSEDAMNISEPAVPEAWIRSIYRLLRPYGGVAALNDGQENYADFSQAIEQVKLPAVEVGEVDSADIWRYFKRPGPLPGAGAWTHQYADAANSVVSKDKLVRAPLGLLWFGGPSNDRVLPRHGHGPSPQVAGGRLVIEGADMLRCVDVYTGRVLWEKDLPGLGKYYDITGHFPGAGEIGSNYVTVPDAVYVIYGDSILDLDPVTGETRKELKVDGNEAERPSWGFVASDGDVLLAAASPVTVGRSSAEPALAAVPYSSASRRLVAFDRHTYEKLWERTAEFNFRHNSIAIAAGKVFCIDGMTDAKRQALARRGVEIGAKPRLLALDAKSGKEIWSTDKDVFGTFLNYSAGHDILLQAGSAYRDRAKDEVGRGMVAYRGSDGKVLWQDLTKTYGGPCLLWRDKIITNGGGGFQLDLLSGAPTGWNYQRMYGCNTAVGCENLLTFRSGAAGFCDLTGDGGTGNIGGFRSSCTANLIAADGVLNAPDYTRTCTCSYQNQCSLALIYMPEAESWTFSNLSSAPAHFGLNIGGPGDRQADDGVTWFDVPSVGGNSPDLRTSISGANLRYVRHHASRIETGSGGSLPWIASSCATGVERIEYELGQSNVAKPMLVRLHFAELENLQPGQRIFHVSINGRRVLEDFDVAKAAGGPFRGVVKEFRIEPKSAQIVVEFGGVNGEPCICGLEITPP